MNMFKNRIGNKRRRTSNSPKTDHVDEQVTNDLHIDDIQENQWEDPQPNGKNLFCIFQCLHIS